MIKNLAAVKFHGMIQRRMLLACCLLCTAAALAQTGLPAAPPVPATIPALLLSDIHFEPFTDPAKVPQLDEAPASKWNAILAAPPSPDQKKSFAALQQTCDAKGIDTSYALLESSLTAMRAQAAGAAFAAVSGDLLSHDFYCKYFTVFPRATSSDYKTFVEKTLVYVLGELDASFPGIPVYVALGNNDSDCGDYRLDSGSEFLKATGAEITRKFPISERQAARESFTAGGYYSVTLPAPIQNARLLVLDDTFMSKSYVSCMGKADPAAGDDQLAWLQKQLDDARANKQKVWVMGHIPPGVNLFASAKKMSAICGGQKPAMFLTSEKMADLLASYGDVIQLAIFAHTHMDEVRLLLDDSKSPAVRMPVPVKMVASISPIHGNNPSFTVAQIDPSTAALMDYRVYSSWNPTGDHANWNEEYDFTSAFHQPDFTSASISRLISNFATDPNGNSQASQNYIRDFSAGSSSPLLQMVWPAYVCTLANHTAQSFSACFCSAAK